MPALQAYRANFRPSGAIERPYAMIGVNVFAAQSDAEGLRLFTSLEQMFGAGSKRSSPRPAPTS